MDNKRLQEIADRMVELRTALESDQEVNLEEIRSEIETLNAEKEEIRSRKELADKINSNTVDSKIIDKVENTEEKRNMENTKSLDSMEYRQAFMEFCQTGQMAEEFRATAMTSANTAVIPVTTLNRIVEKMESYGNILPLVSKLAYPAGVSIPTANLGISASWTSEGSVADKQSAATAAITFGGYKLQTRVAVSFEMTVKSISAFEAAIVNNVSKAMIKALEQAIISGDGVGKPLGITKSDVPSEQHVQLLDTFDYKTLTRIESAIPAAYDSSAILVMNKRTWLEFEGMTDQAGQPIARVNLGINGKPERQLLGRTVVLTDYLPAYATAETGDVVAFAYDLSNYVINTGYDIGVRKYFDENTDEEITKATLIADGKPVDTNGLVLIEK